MEKSLVKNYRDEEWYQCLVEECRAIIIQRVKNSRTELIVGYGELGERICTDPNYKKYGKGNQQFVGELFKDVNINKTTGYYAIKFYETYIREKFPDVSTALETLFPEEGDNLSWNRIKFKYLSASGKRSAEARQIRFANIRTEGNQVEVYFDNGTLVWLPTAEELFRLNKYGQQIRSKSRERA